MIKIIKNLINKWNDRNIGKIKYDRKKQKFYILVKQDCSRFNR